jgi:hypothetical protein
MWLYYAFIRLLELGDGCASANEMFYVLDYPVIIRIKNFNSCTGNKCNCNCIVVCKGTRKVKAYLLNDSLLRKGFPRGAYCQLFLIECNKIHLFKTEIICS